MARFLYATLLLMLPGITACTPDPHLLVFSKTAGFRHDSIEPGIEALRRLGAENGFTIEATEDSTVFSDESLARFDAVVFLSTTQDVLGEPGQQALQRYIQAGGGYVGIHAASDTEYGWPWYGQLVGGYFESHPAIQEARLLVVDRQHESTAHLPDEWIRTDEWYEIDRVNHDVNVLLDIDETSYRRFRPAHEGDRRPLAWYHEFEGGRSWYTALGHTIESYSEPEFLRHVLGGIRWVTDGRGGLDYGRAGVRPTFDRFTREVYDQDLDEPMELDVLPDGRVVFVERRGAVKVHDPRARVTRLVDSLHVYYGLEDGLLGLALDPEWERNRWVYFYYSSPDAVENRLSRFDFDGETLDVTSEKVLLTVPTQRDECCHAGGSVQFGPDGLLYVSTGDNTNPFASDGFSPTDERPGRSAWDAQRTAANSMDLRGKILRIRPLPDGSVEIPTDNLFAADPARGRPEIYVMGNRNPFRIHVDGRTGWLYWGDVGPDANAEDSTRGPAGHDEINQAREAGFFGWPYFIADNRAYHDVDFATGRSAGPRDALAPVNDSPNNTGARDLPEARGAFLWYPYGPSKRFPLVGQGGRTAMAGPVFHESLYPAGPARFPSYFDGKLFVYEWMRHRIWIVTMDAEGRYRWMDTFLPEIPLVRPMDLEFGRDGSLYLLEYGEVWNQRNPDARLSRIAWRGDP